MTRKQHSDETKAAVMAALLIGQSVSSVAKEYNIPKGTVSGWKRKVKKGVAKIATQKRKPLEDKLTDLIYVQLDTLLTQHMAVSNPKWILNQTAADMAVLMGVTQDKLMRMLEAFGRSDTDDSTSET